MSLSHESVGRQLADLQYYGIDRIGPVRSLWQGHDEYQSGEPEPPITRVFKSYFLELNATTGVIQSSLRQIRGLQQGMQKMDVQVLQDWIPLANSGRVLFRQLRCILFVVGETATRKSMLRLLCLMTLDHEFMFTQFVS